MMEEQVRQIVAGAIEAAHPHPFGCYHLCWWEDRIQCRQIHHTSKTHPVFLTVTGDVLATGLSPRHWQIVDRRIGYFNRMTDPAHNESAGPDGDTRSNGAGRRGRGQGRSFQKGRSPVHSPRFRNSAGSGSGRRGGNGTRRGSRVG